MDPVDHPPASEEPEPPINLALVLRNHVATTEVCFLDIQKHGFVTVEHSRAYRQAKAAAWLALTQTQMLPSFLRLPEPKEKP